MITKAVIENYQSHKKTELELVPGTNVIIGKSDSGKSAIFRAINWVVSNRPLGDSFRSDWGGDTRVALYTSDGHIVERIKTASKNEYVIDGTVLRAFGTEVPQKVLDILQLDSFNIQAQMDLPFLLAETPGEAAKILNKAATIDDIDHTIAGLKKSLSRTRNEYDEDKEELAHYVSAMDEYDNLEEIESILDEIEELEEERNIAAHHFAVLERIVERAVDIQEEIEELGDIPNLLEKVATVEGWYTDACREIGKYQKLSQAVESILQTSEELKETEHVEKAFTILRKIEGIYTLLGKTQTVLDGLNRLVPRIQHTQKRFNDVAREILRLEVEYKEIAPDECPLCGAPMEKE